MQKLSIGQMARLNGVSEKTLRIYHEQGLLMPAYVDPDSGYRYYSVMQSAQLDLIQTLKAIGIPLRQIRTMQHRDDIRYFKENIIRQKRRILEQKRELALAEHTVNDLLMSLEAWQQRPQESQFVLKQLPARRALRFGCTGNEQEWAQAFSQIEAWEYCLRRVKSRMREKGIPLTLFRHVGRVIPLEHLRQRDFKGCEALVFVDEDFREAPCFVVPAGEYMTLLCNTVMDKNNCFMENRCLLALLDEIDRQGYEPIGDYIGEVIAESAALHFSQRDMMVELQVPVKKRGPGSC